MYKIAITGKANSGKNTVSKFINRCLQKGHTGLYCKYIAFADPIKQIIRIMFPELPEKFLTGPSRFRSELIPGAFKDDKPISVRDLLIDIGNKMGRSIKESIWLDNFDFAYEKAKQKRYNIVIVTDVRFRNEFDHLKKLGFYQIKLLRDASPTIDDTSETSQDGIKNSEYDYVIYNNGTLKDLKYQVSNLIDNLKP